MAKPRTTKLKVFAAQFGFYDTVVAAPSRAAALRAWGIHQDIFASGHARPTDDPQALKAALAHPEKPLKRAVGSSGPFALEGTSLPEIPDAPKRTAPRAPSKPLAPTPPNPPADRTLLDKAEEALRNVDEQRKREEADFRRRTEELESEARSAQAAYVEGRKSATAAVVKARQAYRAAGGGK